MKRKTLESSNPFRHTPPRCFQLGCCCRTECSTVGSTPQVCRRGRETLYWSWVILQRFFSGKLRVLPLFEFWWKHSPSISWLDARQGRKPVEMMIRSEALASVGWTSSSMTGARHVFFLIFWQTIEGCYQPTRISWNGMSLVGFVANFSNWGLDIGHLIKILWVKW